ncbi:MAG: hypothetical protein ACOYLX_17865, partial [Burkholderiaceae bacterium]
MNPGTNPVLPAGHQVLVREFAESPAQAIEQVVSVVPQPAPDAAALRPGEAIVAVRAAAVGWV